MSYTTISILRDIAACQRNLQILS